MTDIVRFEAELKEEAGKGAARAARRAGRVPCVIYGGNEKEVMLTIPVNKLDKEIKKGGFRTNIVEIKMGGKTITTLPKEFQLHPVSDLPEHVDFLRIGKDTTVKVGVTVKVIDEDKAPGIKRGGIINIVSRVIEFECHPSKIPHNIEVSLAGLEIGDNIHISKIKLPEGISPVSKEDFTVVSITGRTEETDELKTADAPVEEEAATPAKK